MDTKSKVGRYRLFEAEERGAQGIKYIIIIIVVVVSIVISIVRDEATSCHIHVRWPALNIALRHSQMLQYLQSLRSLLAGWLAGSIGGTASHRSHTARRTSQY